MNGLGRSLRDVVLDQQIWFSLTPPGQHQRHFYANINLPVLFLKVSWNESKIPELPDVFGRYLKNFKEENEKNDIFFSPKNVQSPGNLGHIWWHTILELPDLARVTRPYVLG